jgi:ATP-dependent Lhr-like helicase
LNEALQVLVALPENFVSPGGAQVAAAWGGLFHQLVAEKRAARALVGDAIFWVGAERVKAFSTLFPRASFETQTAEIAEPVIARDDALLRLVRGWMAHSGPVETVWLAHTVGLPASDIEAAMLRLEAEGRVLRGQFTGAAAPLLSEEGIKGWRPTIEWCDRRLLARIHRLTLGTLRKEIQPVTRAQFMRWLLRWQHLAPGTQVTAERGVLEVIRQLQGFEAPASAWEPHILAPRVAGYDPQILDQLCLTGAVGWGRLSPHPATLEPNEGSAAPLSGNFTKACHSERSEESRSGLLPEQRFSAPMQSEIPRGVYTERTAEILRCAQDDSERARNDTPGITARRITPSSVAPVTFFVREESDWMMPRHAPLPEVSRALSHVAREVLEFIRQRGASFFADIVRGTGKLKSEVETALWELVAAGLFTADGFDNLRALIDPKRRAGQGRGRNARPRHSTGRWSLLFSGEATDRAKALEAVCRVLLERYGVVFRELTLREEFPFKWRELLITFRRLEDRGEVRGGRFVDGFLGEQFALPVALESLRSARHLEPTGEIVTLSASDPLNLAGIIVPGERVPAISGKTVTLKDGVLECGPSTDGLPL